MSEKARLGIPVILSGVAEADEPLYIAIDSAPYGAARHRTGSILSADSQLGEGDKGLPQLCVPYDPEVISLTRIREMVQAAGADLTARFGHVIWKIEGISHQRRARTVGQSLSGQWRRKMNRRVATWIVAMFPLAIAGAAHGETLRQALIHAYRTNPSLTAARAGLRATDEGVPIAKAAARPTLSATADYQEFVVRSANSFSAPLRAANANANLSFPLYQGGRVKNAIRAADARVESGRANLRFTEADLFTAIVSVYMDVLRDSAIVEFNQQNVAVLETNLQASKDRFEVGDLTRTDVAQSEARLSVARGQLELTIAQLNASLENYLRFVGLPARDLEQPPALPGLPRSPVEAVSLAIENNPQLLAAEADAKAARYDVRVAAASRLPRLSAVANGGYNNYLGTLTGNLPGRVFQQAQTTATIGLSATIPIYQGGLPAAEVRRASELESQALEQTIFVERRVVAEVRAAYSRFQATQVVIQSSQAAVAANELALEGVRAENSVGTRNVLDVLNAEQELLNSRVQLVTARRDAYVAGFTLLAAMGRAEARDLDLFGGSLFEPGFSRKPAAGPMLAINPRSVSDGRIEFVPAPASRDAERGPPTDGADEP